MILSYLQTGHVENDTIPSKVGPGSSSDIPPNPLSSTSRTILPVQVAQRSDCILVSPSSPAIRLKWKQNSSPRPRTQSLRRRNSRVAPGASCCNPGGSSNANVPELSRSVPRTSPLTTSGKLSGAAAACFWSASSCVKDILGIFLVARPPTPLLWMLPFPRRPFLAITDRGPSLLSQETPSAREGEENTPMQQPCMPASLTCSAFDVPKKNTFIWSGLRSYLPLCQTSTLSPSCRYHLEFGLVGYLVIPGANVNIKSVLGRWTGSLSSQPPAFIREHIVGRTITLKNIGIVVNTINFPSSLLIAIYSVLCRQPIPLHWPNPAISFTHSPLCHPTSSGISTPPSRHPRVSNSICQSAIRPASHFRPSDPHYHRE